MLTHNSRSCHDSFHKKKKKSCLVKCIIFSIKRKQIHNLSWTFFFSKQCSSLRLTNFMRFSGIYVWQEKKKLRSYANRCNKNKELKKLISRNHQILINKKSPPNILLNKGCLLFTLSWRPMESQPSLSLTWIRLLLILLGWCLLEEVCCWCWLKETIILMLIWRRPMPMLTWRCNITVHNRL